MVRYLKMCNMGAYYFWLYNEIQIEDFYREELKSERK